MRYTDTTILKTAAINLLQQLISTPSFSKEEHATAEILEKFLTAHDIPCNRIQHNVWATCKYFDAAKPTILLNSHHDTVKPNASWTRDPFDPAVFEGKIFGLGSNDAGGPLVSLIAAFLNFYECSDSRYNLIIAATAEEEISGVNGIEALLPVLPPIDCAIVGEPTQMQLAIAERGLMVLDCVARGRSGHAAREEGENALYKAVADISTLQQLIFGRESPLLGTTKLTVTSIQTPNKAHNIVPAECSFIADVRLNECYTPEEVLDMIREGINSEVQPRSTRLRSTIIPEDHPLVQAGLSIGKSCYGSPTTSDKALMPFPALKMGPGDSVRSHTADEFIWVHEIGDGIDDYIQLLNKVL